MVTILAQCHQLLSGGPEACLIVKFGSFQYVMVPTEVPIYISTHPPIHPLTYISNYQLFRSLPALQNLMHPCNYSLTHPCSFIL